MIKKINIGDIFQAPNGDVGYVLRFCKINNEEGLKTRWYGYWKGDLNIRTETIRDDLKRKRLIHIPCHCNKNEH